MLRHSYPVPGASIEIDAPGTPRVRSTPMLLES
jgi:hypothetical protein